MKVFYRIEEDEKMTKNIAKIPIYHKQNLTIEEAAEYSNIGINRLGMLLREPNCDFLLLVGNKRLVKKQKFDDYINRTEMI